MASNMSSRACALLERKYPWVRDGLAEDDSFQLHVADARHELDVFQAGSGKVIEDERVGVLRRVIERPGSWCGCPREHASPSRNFFRSLVGAERARLRFSIVALWLRTVILVRGLASAVSRAGTIVEALVEIGRGGEEAGAFLREGF